MAKDDANIIWLGWAEKLAKTDDFRRLCPGLPDCAADCLAPCGPIWPKFYVVNGVGYMQNWILNYNRIHESQIIAALLKLSILNI